MWGTKKSGVVRDLRYAPLNARSIEVTGSATEYPSMDSRERVLRALIETGFMFDAADFTEDAQGADAASTQKLVSRTTYWTKLVMRIAIPVINAGFGGHIPGHSGFFNPVIELNLDREKFQADIAKIRECADLIAFKFVYSQPVIVGVCFSDHHAAKQRQEIFKRLDEEVLGFREHTSSMKLVLGSIKMSVTGILLWCFEDSAHVIQFTAKEQADIQGRHFWKKTNTLSWGVDLPGRRITKHQGLPIILSALFDGDKFVEVLARPLISGDV